jgi:hypothetical protein
LGGSIAHDHIAQRSARENVVGIKNILRELEAAQACARKLQLELVVRQLLPAG